jgi:tRNA U34 2-thiouridine synthase MnmA/TrmU
MGFTNVSSTTAFLGKATDDVKDQSYFLSNLRQEQLQRCLFPVGDLPKPQVRQLARSHDLANQDRKDSQGICFLGKLKFDDFLKHYLKDSPGDIRYYDRPESTPLLGSVSSQSFSLSHLQIIGRHNGLWYHTIGQRKGLGDPLIPSKLLHHGPFYVLKKNLTSNELFVTNHWEDVDKPRRICYIDQINWIIGLPFLKSIVSDHDLPEKKYCSVSTNQDYRRTVEFPVSVKLRHCPYFVSANISYIYNKFNTGRMPDTAVEAIRIVLLNKDKGIAPGQFAAIYLDDYCIISGVVRHTVDD